MNSLAKDQAKSLWETGNETKSIIAWFGNLCPGPATVSDKGSQKHSKGCLILATAKVTSWKLVLSVWIISSLYFYPTFAFDLRFFFHYYMKCQSGRRVHSNFHNYNRSGLRSPVDVNHRSASELHLNYVASSCQTFVAFSLCNELALQNLCLFQHKCDGLVAVRICRILMVVPKASP